MHVISDEFRHSDSLYTSHLQSNPPEVLGAKQLKVTELADGSYVLDIPYAAARELVGDL